MEPSTHSIIQSASRLSIIRWKGIIGPNIWWHHILTAVLTEGWTGWGSILAWVASVWASWVLSRNFQFNWEGLQQIRKRELTVFQRHQFVLETNAACVSSGSSYLMDPVKQSVLPAAGAAQQLSRPLHFYSSHRLHRAHCHQAVDQSQVGTLHS